jgi:DNA-binding transcriptional ArsR family regulator
MKPSEIQFSNNLIALCAPQSRRIVSALARKDMTVEQLAKSCKLSCGSISKHCDILIQANLVRIRSVGDETAYTLNREAFRETHDWFLALP